MIGLALGWRLAQRGLGVVVLDRAEPGSGASHAAAGMLAAAGEAEYGEQPLLGLGQRSGAAYPAFAEELRELTAIDVGYRACGSLEAAPTADDAAALRRRHAFLERLGLPVEWLSGSECRELEPALSPRVRGGIHSPHDHQVDPRALSRALAAALQQAGGTLRSGTPVRGLVHGGLELASGEHLAAGQVVVAAGAWIPELDGLPDWITSALRPVKGQILRLRGAPLVSRIVRLPRAYLVPREDGRVVVGASSEEQGHDQTVTAGVVLDLLRYAYEGVPGITELELYETFASLRPGSRDNLPLIGPAGDGLWLACGHYRNGILLAPATAELLADAITGQPAPDLEPFDPGRFAARPEPLHADHAQR